MLRIIYLLIYSHLFRIYRIFLYNFIPKSSFKSINICHSFVIESLFFLGLHVALNF
jgi:hypothetical protein